MQRNCLAGKISGNGVEAMNWSAIGNLSLFDPDSNT